MKRTFEDKANRYRITAIAELSWLKGNAKPYFSLTARGRDHGVEFGGCCHEEILKRWPDLQPLADLHLADIDGVPMHAADNGIYWLAGGTNFAGRFLRAESPCGVAATWETRRGIVVRHFRVSEDVVESELREMLGIGWSELGGFMGLGYEREARKRIAEWCERQQERWANEAQAVIEQFGLDIPMAPR